MKNFYFALIAFMFFALNTNAQDMTLDELKAKKAELAAKAGEAQATADALKGEIGGIQKKIEILAGWRKGVAGNVGFGLNKFSNWAAAANPNSSSSNLGLNLTGFANKMTEKALWNNKLIIQEGFQKVNTAGVDGGPALTDKENHTVDLLNFASLYGYRIHPKFAITALGEFNSSLRNFLEPGVLDIGVGGTWTPTSNLVVVVHPLNYHVAFSGVGENPKPSGSIGAKIRADYTNTYQLAGKNVNFSSTLTSFLPYSTDKTLANPADPENIENQVTPLEYTWINNISFEVWKGIGVGVGFGLRGAKFENADTQSFYNLGLSYSI
ncbi:MAG: hypothetical protein ACJA1A_002254 [Saprospiraceae bacterium]|jgi:hypothetical protein|tara:strand:- start:1973 stop:2944 length:972 start_codon:yes stop_codon:yes gene_type:complete